MVKTLPFRTCSITKSLTEVCLSNGTGMGIMARKHFYKPVFALQKYKIRFDFANIYSTFPVLIVLLTVYILLLMRL